MKRRALLVRSLVCIFVFFTSPIAAQQVQLHPPGSLNVCEGRSLQYAITGGPNGLQDATLSLSLPCGITYQAGSISGAAEADIGNLSGPVFSLPEVPAGDSLMLNLQVDVNCAALPCIDAGELFFITSELQHANGSQGFASDPFNVETANLLITNGENLYWQGTLNQVVFRTLTIRNTRPGRVAAFEFLDTHAGSIAVSSNDGETVVENADTLLLRFGPQDFAQIGNGDGWFDFNEELTITERVEVIDCAYETRDALSELWVRWGCGGSFCQSRRASGKVEIVTAGASGDVLSFFSKNARNPDCYDGGVATQSFRMSRSGQNQNLINFQMTLHQPGNGRGIRLGSVSTSLGISIIDSVAYHDPTLSACGDSVAPSATIYFIDPLPPVGNLSQINWETGYCEPDACVRIRTNWNYTYSYRKECAPPGDQFIQGEGAAGSDSPLISSEISVSGDVPMEDGGTVDVNYQIIGGNLDDTSGQLEVTITIPSFLNLSGSDFALSGVLPQSENITTSGAVHIIELTYPLPLPESNPLLTFPAVTNCGALPDLPCLPVTFSECEDLCTTQELPLYSFSGTASIADNEDCSASGRLSTCANTKVPLLCYEGVCTDTLAGYLDYSFEVERTTLGWPDKDGDLQPDADGIYDFDQMRLDRIAPGDTFELRIDGVVHTDVPGTELEYMVLEVGHENFEILGNPSIPTGSVMNFMIGENKAIVDLSASLEIYDASAGSWYEMDNLDRSFLPGRSIFLYDLSVPSILGSTGGLPSGFRYAEGDSVRIRIRKQLNQNFEIYLGGSTDNPDGIEGLTFFTFALNSRVYLEKLPILANDLLPTCDCQGQRIEVCNLARLNGGPTNDNNTYNNNCVTTEPTSRGSYLRCQTGFGFPSEIRPFFKPRQLRVPKRTNVIIDSAVVLAREEITYTLYPTEDSDYYYFSFPESFPYAGTPVLADTATTIFTSAATAYYAVWLFRRFEGCVADGPGSVEGEVFCERTPQCVNHTNIPESLPISFRRFGPLEDAVDICDLQLAQSTITAFTANFELDFPLVVRAGSSANIPYDNLYLRPVYPTSVFDSIQVVNAETGEAYPEVNGIFQLGSVITPDTLILQLRGRSSSCGTETIRLDYGFDCSPFTDPAQEPCALESETLTIDFPPGLIDMQAEDEDRSADLCDTMPRTQALLFNAGLGAVYELQAEVTLPVGMDILPGSCAVEYPAGSGQTYPLPDPELLQGRTFIWDFATLWPLIQEQGLPGVNSSPGNSFYLQFDTETNCDFISGTRILYRMRAEQTCKEPTNTVAKVTGRYQIEGVEPPYASNLNVNLSGSLNCGDTLALNATFQYPANTDANLYVTLPAGIAYVPGSTAGNTDHPEPTLQAGQLKWTVNSPSSDVTLSFSIVAEEGIECAVPVLSHFTTTKVPAVCVSEGQPCEIEVVTGDANLPLSVDKAAYEITDISAMAPSSLSNDLQLEATITNTADPNDLPLQATLYIDQDGDGTVSPPDSLLQTLTLDGINQAGGSTQLNALLPDLPRTYWCRLLLVLEAEANCACQTLTIPINGIPILKPEEIVLCWDESAELGVDPLTGYTYQWSDAEGLSCTQCPETIFYPPGGSNSQQIYSFELQETAGNCTVSHPFEITVNPEPFIFSEDITICQGDTASLIASLGEAFAWSGPNLIINDEQAALAAPANSATYTVTITDNLGCTGMDSVSVEVLSAPTLMGEPVQSFCFGPPAQLQVNAEPGTAYEWVNADDILSDIYSLSPVVEVQEDFTYQLQADNGVCTRLFDVSVDFFEAFEIGGVPDTLQACLGDTVSVSLTGGVQYDWSGAEEVICQGSACAEVGIPVPFSESSFLITATDSAQCEAERLLTIQSKTDTILPAQPESICEGDSLNIFGAWVSAAGLYCDTTPTVGSCVRVECLDLELLPTWSVNDSAAICQGETYDFYGTPLTEPGLYTEPLTASNGCDSLITLDLAVLPAVSENLQSTICQTDTLFFNGQPLTEEGTYTAEYQTTQGCDSTVTLELEVLPEFETPVSATICEGETYSFNGQDLSVAGTYGAELQSQAGCDSLVVLQLSVDALSETFFDTTLCEGAVLELSGQAFETAGDYTLQLTDDNGCDSIVFLMLDYYPPPLFEVETMPDFGYGEGSLTIFLADSTHVLTWEDGSTELERTNLQAGFYYAGIEDEWGCVTEIEVEVPAGELRLAMPNTFTPNGDGDNDFFNVVGNVDARVVAFRIFNRWGQQVYDNGQPERGWDGSFEGQQQPAEVYFYQIEVQTPDGLWIRQGDVTLLR